MLFGVFFFYICRRQQKSNQSLVIRINNSRHKIGQIFSNRGFRQVEKLKIIRYFIVKRQSFLKILILFLLKNIVESSLDRIKNNLENFQ
ncbi:hypothetical protein CW752_01900 [Chryseobacterium sp. PMSZPI]|nr:hypothetical protein CW752_01900 [Chryseobacterium sp. PMSZPI]